MHIRQKFIIGGFLVCLLAAGSMLQLPTTLPAAPAVALAQGGTCPDIVKAALAVSDKQCSRIGRNKVCYGNTALKIDAQSGVTNLKFNSPGDVADTKSIKSLTLSALDTLTNTWGVALMRLQADLPTASSDNVTLVLFGDVTMFDATQDANLERPTQIAELLTAQPSPTLTNTAVVTAAATTPVNAKPTRTPRPTATAKPAPPYSYQPMQAFYFKSSPSDPTCAEAPHDGILVQSPQGKQKVELSVDGARIEIGSTVFLQAQASGYLTVSTLEGSATVSAFGQAETATTFYRVRVPLDANLRASGPPLPPEFYDNNAVQALPVNNLPAPVTILPAPPIGSVVSQWRYSRVAFQHACPAGLTFTPGPRPNASVIVSPDGKIMWVTFASGNVYVLDGAPDGTYTLGTPGPITLKLSLHFVSPTHIEGQSTARVVYENGPNAGQPVPNCTSDGTVTLDMLASLTPVATLAATQAATP